MHIGPNDQSAQLWAFLFRFFIYSVIMRKYCRLYCLINIRDGMPPVLQKKREKKRRLDNAVAGTSKIRRFTAGEDET